MQQSPEQQQPKQKRKRRLILLIVLILAVLAAAGGTAWYFLAKNANRYERYQFDTAAIEGRIQHMTEEEIRQELNRIIEEGMFNISIASAIVFETPQSEGQARIENVASNRYHMQVDITLDETGETVYSSKLIKPGYSIDRIRLNRRLPPGEYAATAVFNAITQQELQIYGTVGAQIRLYVLDGQPTPTPSPTPTAGQ